MRQELKIVIILFIICVYFIKSNGVEGKVFVKLTNAHCESFNKSWVVVNECRLRAIKRDVTNFNLNVTFLYPANTIKVNANFLKRANGYKPFILNVTVDACEFIVKKNNPIGNFILKFHKPFSNINHSCPYVGDQIIKGLDPNVNGAINLPFPNGDYALMMTWFLTKKPTFVTNVYFTFNS